MDPGAAGGTGAPSRPRPAPVRARAKGRAGEDRRWDEPPRGGAGWAVADARSGHGGRVAAHLGSRWVGRRDRAPAWGRSPGALLTLPSPAPARPGAALGP